MSDSDPQVLPPTSLALTDNPALVAVHTKLESVRENEDRLNQFILEALVFTEESAAVLKSAGEFPVDSESALQVADVIQAGLKQDVSTWEDRRLGITRPLDDLKAAVMDPLRDGIINRKVAIDLYQSKISAYRRELKIQAEKAQREAERIVQEQKEKQLAEARKLDERASKLKNLERAESLMREADEIRQAVAMTPDSVALAVSAPATVASSVSEPWIVEGFPDEKAFRHWLADHPEWWAIAPLKLDTRPMNRFADQCHVLDIPGVKFRQKDVFRSKAR